ncbi:hypothetical protein SITYG_15430 [Streptococcus intermedius]|uniref:Uncharacterized protein n=1 Tax=Streptococcus intermedius TaxID=1338 RepID=A0AAD1FK37_STRIT|nr:hypothetical protein SITYG_15430 [Streptococcus intermedius]
MSRKLYKKILKGFSSVLDRIKFFFYHLQKISTLSIKIIFMTVINQGYYYFFLIVCDRSKGVHKNDTLLYE